MSGSKTIDKRGLQLYLAGCLDSLQMVADRIGARDDSGKADAPAAKGTAAPGAPSIRPPTRNLTGRHILDVLRVASRPLMASEIGAGLGENGHSRSLNQIYTALTRLVDAGYVSRSGHQFALRASLPVSDDVTFDED